MHLLSERIRGKSGTAAPQHEKRFRQGIIAVQLIEGGHNLAEGEVPRRAEDYNAAGINGLFTPALLNKRTHIF
jgi:hypothetical protein